MTLRLKQLLLAIVFAALNTTAVTLSAASPTAIEINTEENPPFNFTDPKTGKLIGIGTELIEAIVKDMGIDATYSVTSWEKAYAKALLKPNSLIYSIARTEEREAQFQWVCTIDQVKSYVYSLEGANKVTIQTLEDAKQYQVGLVKDSYLHQYLLRQGFVEGKNLIPLVHPEQVFKTLISGRLKLAAHNDHIFGYHAAQYGFSRKLFDKQIAIDHKATPLCLAFNRDTDQALVDRFRQSFERQLKDGKLERLRKKYADMLDY